MTIAIYFIGVTGSVDGGADTWLVTSIVIVTFVVSLAVLTSAIYNFYRNPNHQPTFALNPNLTFWVAASVAFFALVEIFYLASGVLIGALSSILASVGLTVPDVVARVLFWLLMGTEMIAAAIFLWKTWKRFNALPD